MNTIDEVLRDFDHRLSELERRVGVPSPSLSKPIKEASKSMGPKIAPHHPVLVSAKVEPTPDVTTGSLFGVIGIGFVLLAAVFFLKLTIDSGWLTPLRQVVLAGFFGVTCLLLPHSVKRLGDDYGALLSGTGAAVLHITWLGAYEVHHIFDAQTALIMASAVGVLSILLNAEIGNAVFVVVAIAGTYLAAPLIGFHTGDFTALSNFFLIWNLSFSALSFALKRRDILLVAAYFAVLTVGLFSLTQRPLSQDLAYSFLVLQGLQLAIFSAAMFSFSVFHKKPLLADESWGTCLLLLIFYADVFSLVSVLAPELAPWAGVALSIAVLAMYSLAGSAMKMKLESTPAITTFAALVLLHSLYFKLTPDEGKPLFSLALALLIALGSRTSVPDAFRFPLRVAMIAVGYGALLTFSRIFSPDLTLFYHFSFGLTAVILASALVGTSPSKGSEISSGALLLGFGHIEMLCGIYQLSFRVAAISGSLFVSLIWGLYALTVLAFSYSRRDRVVGQSAVIILAAVSLKAAFYDVLSTGSLARVLSLLAAGLLLYACGWVFRQMQLWESKT